MERDEEEQSRWEAAWALLGRCGSKNERKTALRARTRRLRTLIEAK
jgi:hypothetical protein